LCELFPAFQFLSGVVPVRTPCQYQAEMSIASEVVPLPVLMKDEKKYAEVVNVLDQLEVWVCLGTNLPKTGTPSEDFFFAGRHVTSVFQGLSLSLTPGDGKKRTLGSLGYYYYSASYNI